MNDRAWNRMNTDHFDIERRAVRAILLTPEGFVLLMRFIHSRTGQRFWIAPGGGLEPGESVDEGIRRELHEELGLTEFTLGPLIWLRQHTFMWTDKRLRQHERYHIVHIDRFEPAMSDPVESKSLDEFRRWRIEDLARAREVFVPKDLARIITEYLAHGAPVEDDLIVEVLAD